MSASITILATALLARWRAGATVFVRLTPFVDFAGAGDPQQNLNREVSQDEAATRRSGSRGATMRTATTTPITTST